MPPDRASRKKRALLLAALGALALLLALIAWTARSPARMVPEQETEGAVDAGVATEVAPAEVIGEGEPPVSRPVSSRASESMRATPGGVLVRGRVTDRRTNEPVPELELHLRSNGAEVRTTTAVDGGFTSSGAYDLEDLDVEIRDAGEHVTKAKRPPELPAAAEWEIEIEIGPTVPVVLAVRDAEDVDPAQWKARIVETARPEDSAGEIQARENALAMLRPCAGCGDREWPWQALRPGAIPWIRYPRSFYEPDRRYRLLLVAESSERLQRGLSHLRSTVGIQPPAVVDPLERFVELEGRVVDENGKAIDKARVIALPPQIEGGAPGRTPQWRAGHTDGSGHFRLRDLALGETVVCAYASARPAVITSVVIDSGRNTLGEPLRLKAQQRRTEGAGPGRAKTAGADRARRRSSGSVGSYLRLRLACVGPYERAWVLERSEREDMHQPFEVGDLPAALPADQIDYAWIERAESFRHRSFVRWPQRGDLLVPEHVDLGIGQRGEPLALAGEDQDVLKTWISFEAAGSLVGCIHGRDLERMSLARGAELDWAVWQRGCAPVFGRRSDLVDEEGALVVRAQPGPGWGAVLWFRARDRERSAADALRGLGYVGDDTTSKNPELCAMALEAPPLSAVRVLADGELAATSDREGVARLACARLPQRLVLVAEGWHLVGLDRLETQSSAPAIRYVAWMERD